MRKTIRIQPVIYPSLLQTPPNLRPTCSTYTALRHLTPTLTLQSASSVQLLRSLHGVQNSLSLYDPGWFCFCLGCLLGCSSSSSPLLAGWRSDYHRIWKIRPLLLYSSGPSFLRFSPLILLLLTFPFQYLTIKGTVAPLCGGKSSIQSSSLGRKRTKIKKLLTTNLSQE